MKRRWRTHRMKFYFFFALAALAALLFANLIFLARIF